METPPSAAVGIRLLSLWLWVGVFERDYRFHAAKTRPARLIRPADETGGAQAAFGVETGKLLNPKLEHRVGGHSSRRGLGTWEVTYEGGAASGFRTASRPGL